jgi:hypothetical protein
MTYEIWTGAGSDPYDADSHRLAGQFTHKRQWLGKRQKIGILNKRDLMEVAGDEALRKVIEIIKEVENARR